MQKLEELLEWGGTKKDIAFLVISGAALLLSIFGVSPFPFDMAWIAIILCGIPIILEAVIGLVTALDIKADVLVSIALVASVIIREDFAAGEVAFIMQLGALLEDLTVAKARAGIEKLVHLTPRTARRISAAASGNDTAVAANQTAGNVAAAAGNQAAGAEEIIPAEQVKVGDLLRVLPGEAVPVDGVIISGETSVNQAVMTGESLPVDKKPGDTVSSGTVNQFGAFEMRAEKVGEDSSIQRMIRLVQSADAGKAKIVGIADRWATWIVVIALTAAALTWLISGEIIRAVTILVVFCPCALVLATPTAIMAAIGNATKHGFLVREGDALERLSTVKRIMFDKTGTLTYGTPQVTAVESILPDISARMLYTYAAGSELNSEHPLGKAIVRCYKTEAGEPPLPPDRFHMLPGRGVRSVIRGKIVLAGNSELLRENHISLPDEVVYKTETHLKEGSTVIYLAVDGICAGFIALADTLRQDASDAVDELKASGVIPVLLTGDHENAALHIARQLHIDEVHANCLPEDKLSWIDASQKGRLPVCMIGDGINDAPALKKALVGIAMGKVGSDIAVDAADIALVNDDIRELPHLLKLSRRMMNTIRLNLTFSMALNFAAIILAITGILNPVVGALVHNAGSVVVIVNSAFLLGWKRRN